MAKILENIHITAAEKDPVNMYGEIKQDHDEIMHIQAALGRMIPE